MLSIVMMLLERAGLIAYVVRMISGWLALQVEQALRSIRLTHVSMTALLIQVVGDRGSGQTCSAHRRETPQPVKAEAPVYRPLRTQHSATGRR